jgi:hypothetical protein
MSECTPGQLIKAIRDLSPLVERVCLNGSCYRLFEVVKVVFPEAEPWIDSDGHVWIRVGDRFYDIQFEIAAEIMLTADRWTAEPMDAEQIKFHKMQYGDMFVGAMTQRERA